MKKIKSQVAVEFLIFVGMGFLIVILFTAMVAKQTKEVYDVKEDILVKDLALKVQSEFNLAATVEEGYTREFEVPKKLDNINYTIFIINDKLIVESKNSVYTARLPKATGSNSNFIEPASNLLISSISFTKSASLLAEERHISSFCNLIWYINFNCCL